MRKNEEYTEAEFLEDYKKNKKDIYEKASNTVDMLLFTIGSEKEDNYRKLPEKQLQVLLIKRKDHPYKNTWSIPGGFVNMNENLLVSAQRELLEETNLENIYMEQLYTWGDVDRDPRMRVISTSYMGLVDKEKTKPIAGDDAAEVKWFSVKLSEASRNQTYDKENILESIVHYMILDLESEDHEIKLQSKLTITQTVRGNIVDANYQIIDNGGLGFDHAKAITYAINRLRGKIAYTTIAFHLLPKEFTISELQSVYSIILGKELIAPNFRRKTEHMLIPVSTPKEVKNQGHRPAQMYRFNPTSAIIGGI